MYDFNENEYGEDEINEENEEEILGFSRLEHDIIESNNDINALTFTHQILNNNQNNLNIDNEDDLVEENVLNENDEYNPTLKLNIKLGTDELARYQCADHKLDLVVKKAIKMHTELTNIIFKINKSNKHFKRCCKLSKIFREKKCRLRIQGKQRWSLVYLILESTKKAYDKNAFDQNDQERCCPVSIEKIELYLQILKPLYLLNIVLQSNHSTIADVIPGKKNKKIVNFKHLFYFFLYFCRYKKAY